MEDFLPEKESWKVDSHPDVVFGGMPLRTASGEQSSVQIAWTSNT